MANIVDVQSITSQVGPGLFDINLLANNGGHTLSQGTYNISDYSYILLYFINTSWVNLSNYFIDCQNLLIAEYNVYFQSNSWHFRSYVNELTSITFSIGQSGSSSSISFDLDNNIFTINMTSGTIYFGRLYPKT